MELLCFQITQAPSRMKNCGSLPSLLSNMAKVMRILRKCIIASHVRWLWQNLHYAPWITTHFNIATYGFTDVIWCNHFNHTWFCSICRLINNSRTKDGKTFSWIEINPMLRLVLSLISLTFYLIPMALLFFLYIRIFGAATHSSKNIRRSSQHQLLPGTITITKFDHLRCFSRYSRKSSIFHLFFFVTSSSSKRHNGKQSPSFNNSA